MLSCVAVDQNSLFGNGSHSVAWASEVVVAKTTRMLARTSLFRCLKVIDSVIPNNFVFATEPQYDIRFQDLVVTCICNFSGHLFCHAAIRQTRVHGDPDFKRFDILRQFSATQDQAFFLENSCPVPGFDLAHGFQLTLPLFHIGMPVAVVFAFNVGRNFFMAGLTPPGTFRDLVALANSVGWIGNPN